MDSLETLRNDIHRFFAGCNSDLRRKEAINALPAPEAKIIVRVALERFATLGKGNARDWAKRHIASLDKLP